MVFKKPFWRNKKGNVSHTDSPCSWGCRNSYVRMQSLSDVHSELALFSTTQKWANPYENSVMCKCKATEATEEVLCSSSMTCSPPAFCAVTQRLQRRERAIHWDGYIHVSQCPSCLLAFISYCFFSVWPEMFSHQSYWIGEKKNLKIYFHIILPTEIKKRAFCHQKKSDALKLKSFLSGNCNKNKCQNKGNREADYKLMWRSTVSLSISAVNLIGDVVTYCQISPFLNWSDLRASTQKSHQPSWG